jgi:predicted aminopeptidase
MCAIARRLRLPLLTALAAALSGCGGSLKYVLVQGYSQLDMLAHSEPIADVLARDTLDAETRRKLTLVVQARDFARDTLGLSVGDSFQLFHDTGGKPVAYNLSASRQDRFEPYAWTFPIVGRIDYLGFFSQADAEAVAADLRQRGYDTFTYPVNAYSTLGWFPDPVQSTLLNEWDGELAETVIHELAHNTVYVSGNSTFNESLATFIGQTGVELFFAQQGAAGQATIVTLRRRHADGVLLNAWLIGLYDDLSAYYARDLPAEEKIAGREAVFQAARDRFVRDVQPRLAEPDRYAGWARIPTNNAFVLANRRYNLDLDVFAAVYAGTGADYAAFLDVLWAAAASDDPFAYLRSHAQPAAAKPATPQSP